MENDLISSNQSWYKPEGSSINQLLSIAHEIQNLLIVVMMLKVVFLTIRKLLASFRSMGSCLNWKKKHGMSGSLRILLQDYLDERKEKVVLNGQIFSWANVIAEVPLVQFLVQCFFSSALFEPTSLLI